MATSKKVDINTAKLEDFESLTGVGHAKAESITEHRKVSVILIYLVFLNLAIN